LRSPRMDHKACWQGEERLGLMRWRALLSVGLSVAVWPPPTPHNPFALAIVAPSVAFRRVLFRIRRGLFRIVGGSVHVVCGVAPGLSTARGVDFEYEVVVPGRCNSDGRRLPLHVRRGCRPSL